MAWTASPLPVEIFVRRSEGSEGYVEGLHSEPKPRDFCGDFMSSDMPKSLKNSEAENMLKTKAKI
jgi:hypothetical protein